MFTLQPSFTGSARAALLDRHREMKKSFPIVVGLVLAVVPSFARTVAEWPLGCDEKVCPVKNNVF